MHLLARIKQKKISHNIEFLLYRCQTHSWKAYCFSFTDVKGISLKKFLFYYKLKYPSPTF